MQKILPIMPMTDLRVQAKEILAQAQQQPIIITQNGRASVVMLNYQLYNEMIAQCEQLELLAYTEREGWATASEESLQKIWDNPTDAAYDDWQVLYGLSTR
ncbi:MAG: type II toxin-antitoxin system Phd/YefM family antitoxin [Anaerolineae bacterium]|nr:type II toxin-antitoxin system Phd/YefM family antitoxin [Anaerolineae bacterium]